MRPGTIFPTPILLTVLVALLWATASPGLAQAQAGGAPGPRPGAPAPAAPRVAKPKPPTVVELDARLVKLEAELAELGKLAVDVPGLAKTLADIGAAVATLRQDVDQLRAQAAGEAQLVARVDGIDQRLASLSEALAAVKADVATLMAPKPVKIGGDGGRWEDGFVVVDEPRFLLKIGGYAQLHYTATAQEAFDETKESGFSLRRARLALAGRAYSPKLTYKLQLELAGGASLLDYWFEGQLGRGVSIKAGQFKVPFSRSFITPAEKLTFVERPVAVDELRYDRDLGVWLGFSGSGGKLQAGVGVWNGAGRKRNENDNIDPLLGARVQVTALGEPFSPEEGDFDGTAEPRLAVGAGATFENAPVPDAYGFGTAEQPLDTDVDGDGDRDNVRIMQAGLDVALRWRGLGVEAEGFVRGEDWGVIPNQQAKPFTPEYAMFGGYVQASYFVLPARLLLGARFSRTAVSLLGGGRARTATPPGDRLQEISAFASYFRERHGMELGLMWSFLDWSSRDGSTANTKGAGEQRFLLEAQLGF
jgi:hypothetical protein